MTARVVVVGGGFGRVHARAVVSHPGRYQLAGVAGQGGASSREMAKAHGVPYFDLSRQMDDVAQVADVVCVAVGSAISGGPGTELAQGFLERGLHVVQEHPLHPDEVLAAARTARRYGVQHRVNLHYRHVRPVKVFVDAVRRLTARSEVLFVDAAAPVHVLHPLIDVLAAALGGVRPWAWNDVTGKGPLRSVDGIFAGAPLSLRVQNQLDPLDRDNHALLWHRIAVGTSAGVLTLADTHGPVLWSPRWHAERDQHHRLVMDGEGLAQGSTTVLAGSEPTSMTEVMAQMWPDAVASALDELLEAAEARADPLKQAQLDLSTARIWNDLTSRLGSPERITAQAPPRISVAELTARPVVKTHEPAPDQESGTAAVQQQSGGYSVEAEFYDLVAGQRTTSVEEVLQVLRAAQLGPGPIVEIGAGTGLLTVAVARAFPGRKIVAAEPDPIMRAVLTSKVVRDPELRDRVTVTDGSAPDLDLPERISAALVCGVAGHLTPDSRRVLWKRIAERLLPRAPLLVELLALGPGADFGPIRLGQARIGSDDVHWNLAVQPGPDGSELTSTWEVLRDGEVRRSTTTRHTWRPVTLQDVADESGLELDVLVAGGTDGPVPLGVLHHPVHNLPRTQH